MCQCGCGAPAPLAKYSDASRGYVKGEPLTFLPNHHRKSRRTWTVTPGPLDTDCWIWDGKPEAQGYGVLTLTDNKKVKAHRWVWEQHIGPIPDGAELDHLCRVRQCVNPAHLEPVTHQVNTTRGIGPTAQNFAKTHCLNGHPLSGENVRIATNGQRVCRECDRERGREKMRRKRADPEKAAALKAYKNAWRAQKRLEGETPP